MENKQIENAINFLLFSYFGITLDDDADSVRNAAINRAYRDASSHVLSIKNDDEKAEMKKAATILIIDRIKEIKETYTESNFNKWHEELICGNESENKYGLMQIYESCTYKKDKNGTTRKFTCGIAQKWVNMTMKYLYILNHIIICFDKNNTFSKYYGKTIDSISEYLHIPLDSYIFKAVKEEFGIDANSKLNTSAWSKIENYDNYKEYQDNIAEKLNNVSPIDWEAKAWIKAAKKKNG